jgi:DNA replication protein DnaC
MRIDAEISREIALSKMGTRDLNSTGAKAFNIGSMYTNATLSRVLMDESKVPVLNNWMKEKNKILLIQGSPGTGKTYISAAVLNYYYDERLEAFYTNHRRFISKIQEGFSKDHTQDYSVNQFAYKDILVFDDLGAATNTDWQQEVILDLIDKRVSMQKKTLFTTNLTNAELYETFGSRTASRLLAKDNFKIEMWTGDMRQENIDVGF